MNKVRIEKDSLGEIEVPDDKLWGAQTERSLKYFSIGNERMPQEMIPAFALLKKAAAIVNTDQGRLTAEKRDLIIKACDAIYSGEYNEHFPLHVWMTGSGTQYNMNVNEVIANLCCQYAKQPLGSKNPVHPNDDVNMSQSTNDAFPSAMYMAAAIAVNTCLIPSLQLMEKELINKANAWSTIVKIGRTHLQDATPITLGQEFSGYAQMITDNIERIKETLHKVYQLSLGGTAVGTGINALPEFAEKVAKEIASLTKLPFVTAPNKFAAQGAHDALVQLSATIKTTAVSLNKIANDIRLLACGPRAGIHELDIPSNEPGSSIMPGKVNPTQCEALTMVTFQVMANDHAIAMGGAGGHLEMNAYKPLIIYNLMSSIQMLSDSTENFTRYLLKDSTANNEQINTYVERSLMLVTSLSPIIGYDNAAELAHYAYENNLSLKEGALKLKLISEEDFDKVVDASKMIEPYVPQ